MLRLAFDFIITWRETRTRPNAYLPSDKFTVSLRWVSFITVSIRPRACFFPLFSFLPLWLHYNLNPLCVQY